MGGMEVGLDEETYRFFDVGFVCCICGGMRDGWQIWFYNKMNDIAGGF